MHLNNQYYDSTINKKNNPNPIQIVNSIDDAESDENPPTFQLEVIVSHPVFSYKNLLSPKCPIHNSSS